MEKLKLYFLKISDAAEASCRETDENLYRRWHGYKPMVCSMDLDWTPLQPASFFLRKYKLPTA